MIDNKKLIFEILDYCIEHPKEIINIKLQDSLDLFYRISCGQKQWIWEENQREIFWQLIIELDDLSDFRKNKIFLKRSERVKDLLEHSKETKSLFKLKIFW